MLDFGYKGKKCVVTGCASGMGKATAEKLIELGAEVYGMDWNEDVLPGMKKFVQVNLMEKDSIDEAFQQLPDKFDQFFGVAGISGLNHDAVSTFTVDFIANKYITDTYLADRIMDGGAISYVSSVGGSKWYKYENEYKAAVEATDWDGMVDAISEKGLVMGVQGYVVAKRAINYYMKYIVMDFGKKEIRVNSVNPGLTASALEQDFQILSGGNEQAANKMFGIYDRSAKSEEIANALVFLNSDLAYYINGVDLFVDAGREAMILTRGMLDNNASPMCQ